jgi:hypothetical protein
VDVMVSGTLGILFAYLVLLIGSKYLIFKGLFYSGAVWYLYYPTITVVFMKATSINVQTAFINGLLAGLFGIVLAKAFGWLQTET